MNDALDFINNILNNKNKIFTAFLALLFGGYGIHKFYLGYFKEGFIVFLLCYASMILNIHFIYTIMCIIGIIEGIIYITKSDNEFYNLYVKNYKGWF